jgi:hypothetical protein
MTTKNWTKKRLILLLISILFFLSLVLEFMDRALQSLCGHEVGRLMLLSLGEIAVQLCS